MRSLTSSTYIPRCWMPIETPIFIYFHHIFGCFSKTLSLHQNKWLDLHLDFTQQRIPVCLTQSMFPLLAAAPSLFRLAVLYSQPVPWLVPLSQVTFLTGTVNASLFWLLFGPSTLSRLFQAPVKDSACSVLSFYKQQ